MYGVSLAQTPVYYFYDDAGNRTQRTIIELGERRTNDNNEQVDAEEENTEDNSFQDSIGNYDISVYPNPTANIVNLVIDPAFLELESKKLFVFDMQGKRLKEEAIRKERLAIDFSIYAKGQYVLKVIAGELHREWQIVKQWVIDVVV